MVHSMYKFTYFHLGRKTSKWNDPGMKPLWWPKDVEYRNVNWGNNKPHVDELVKIMEAFNTDYCRISNGNSSSVKNDQEIGDDGDDNESDDDGIDNDDDDDGVNNSDSDGSYGDDGDNDNDNDDGGVHGNGGCVSEQGESGNYDDGDVNIRSMSELANAVQNNDVMEIDEGVSTLERNDLQKRAIMVSATNIWANHELTDAIHVFVPNTPITFFFIQIKILDLFAVIAI